mgnify:CR=1 FL=1
MPAIFLLAAYTVDCALSSTEGPRRWYRLVPRSVVIVALAAAVGTTRRLELKRGWSAPPILWAAIVGESGTAKTPAFKLVMRPARDRQRKALERHAEDVLMKQAGDSERGHCGQ